MPEAHNIDVLLINPERHTATYQGLGQTFAAIEPPALVGLFATYLIRRGLQVAIIDMPASDLSPDQLIETISADYKPRLIAMIVYGLQPSASTQNMPVAGAFCRALKADNPHYRILMAGTHPAALPRRTMMEEAVDFVCDREGPETLFLTAQALSAKCPDFKNIPSLWYRAAGRICNNAPSTLIKDLDSAMPIPAWDLLPMTQYRAHNWHCFEDIHNRQPYASIHTSLGCPYHCNFCCIHAPFGKSSYRMWHPDTVIKQIDVLVNQYGVRNIKIVDEMFVLNRYHVNAICDRIIARGYDLNIWAYARIDSVKDEFLDKLREAGIRWLALGIESASQHVRDGVEKGKFGSTDILETIQRIQNAGIYVIGNYIFGLPDDTHKTMQDTLALAKEANCEFANFYCAMAYPGSKLYNTAQKNDWALPKSWGGYSQHSEETLPLPTEQLTAKDVLQFRDDAFFDYFTHKNYLDMVRKKFGNDVVSHIHKMTSIKLKRHLLEAT